MQSNIIGGVDILKAQLEEKNARLKELEQASLNSTSQPILQNIAARLEDVLRAIENQNHLNEQRFADLDKKVGEHCKFLNCAPE